jgi:hypothetical protein
VSEVVGNKSVETAMLYGRLRSPETPWTVGRSLPVLLFGDLFAADVATVGLNPSQQEYLSPGGELLTGAGQRFATLDSLGSAERESLSDEQCAEALAWMRDYYAPGKPVYRWFAGLGRVVEGFGASFVDGTAAHLDLVQEATAPVWSGLPSTEQEALLRTDLPFLAWEIESFPLRALICTGKTVGEHVCHLLAVDVLERGELARVRWWTGVALAGGRTVGVAGWNLPLARPTGLGAASERELGALLAERLKAIAA